jgi:hypothetical protein
MVEKVTIQADEKDESLETVAAAQKEAKTAEQPEPKLAGEEETPERPEWLPEKFETPEDLAKAYAELEKAKSKGEKPTDPDAEAATDEAAEKAVGEAGLDMEALSAEYSENGELTQDSLDALAKVGITGDMVQSYIAGQEAQATEAQKELLEPVGGDIEVYNEMTAWAGENLSEAEIEEFNSVLETGNPASVKMAIRDLSNKYQGVNGTEPGRQLSGKPNTSGVSTYESTADLMKDMSNPEYAKNPAFRAKVEAKLGRSNIL